ncbi:MAG: hypothetical protein V1834_04660 [Candidatus Micrarchaeota archaeon]
MKRENFIRYGTIAIILFFVVGMFWQLLYIPDTSSNGPEASPEQTVFKGAGRANATVVQLGYGLLASCSANIEGELAAVDGVASVFRPTSSVYSIKLLQNASNNTVSGVTSVLNSACSGSALLREAVLSFGSEVELVSLDNSTNETESVSTYALNNYRDQSGTLPMILAYHESGDVVPIAVQASLVDGELAVLRVQEYLGD